jgi:superfamily II DNA helicase RecQ
VDSQNGLENLSKQGQLGRVILDEAHCIYCDDSFRPQYRQLGRYIGQLQLPVLCLTASMTRDVVGTLVKDLQLKIRNDIFLRGSPELHLKNHVLTALPKSHEDDVSGVVKSTIRDCADGPGIVYVLRKNDAVKVSEALQKKGVESDYFHADQTDSERKEVKHRWESGHHRVPISPLNIFHFLKVLKFTI